MSAITMLQLGRGLYKWRKIIALAVIAESIFSYKAKHSKKHKKRPAFDAIIEDLSSAATRFAKQAENYFQGAKKHINR